MEGEESREGRGAEWTEKEGEEREKEGSVRLVLIYNLATVHTHSTLFLQKMKLTIKLNLFFFAPQMGQRKRNQDEIWHGSVHKI